jgi:uncharacterized protein (TIGR02996 family)
MLADEDAFLAAIRANPADDTARLVYADWLDERGGPEQAEYLRLLSELRRVSSRLGELRAQVPAEWARSVSPWCRVVLVRPHAARMIQTIKLVREVTGYGLAEAKRLAESFPVAIASGLSLDAATAIARAFTGTAEVAIEADPAKTAW